MIFGFFYLEKQKGHINKYRFLLGGKFPVLSTYESAWPIPNLTTKIGKKSFQAEHFRLKSCFAFFQLLFRSLEHTILLSRISGP